MGMPVSQGWGVTLEDSFKPSAACTEYTDFLQQISTREVQACMGVCMFPATPKSANALTARVLAAQPTPLVSTATSARCLRNSRATWPQCACLYEDGCRLHGAATGRWAMNPCLVLCFSAKTFTLRIDLGDARAQSVPCILAAMTPCNRLYAFLGAQMAGAQPGSDNPYAEWLRTYTSPAFQALPQRMEALLDELGSGADFGVLRSSSPASP